MFEQRWVYSQVEPLYERQLEQDILKKLQEYCRSMVSQEEMLPDRSAANVPNYCKVSMLKECLYTTNCICYKEEYQCI